MVPAHDDPNGPVTRTAVRPRNDRRRTIAVLIGGAVVAFALLTLLAVQINSTNEAARRGLEERQASRTALARQFIDTYTAELLERVRTTAELGLTVPDPTYEEIEHAARELRTASAVLLDADGRVIQITPPRPELIGQRVTDRYPHLRSAMEGNAAFSAVVPAASTGTPVVALATPFDTPSGKRVLGAGFRLERTPLGAFLRNFSALPGNAMYLVDPSGVIADANVPLRAETLAEQDPALAAAVTPGATSGSYTGSDGERFFVVESTTSAPWRLIMSVPKEGLYASVARSSILPWLLFAAFAAASVTSIALVTSVMHQRRRLAHLARRDALTGLYNRRHVDDELRRLTQRGSRTDQPTAVLIIDVDHFKRVNDEHGHHRGDEVLRGVADTLAANVRHDDVVSRWGGEEFMVVAPDTSLDDAEQLAERLRRAVRDDVAVGGVRVTASVGFAVDHHDEPDATAARADQALYRAKEDGRDRSVTMDRAGAPA